MSRILRVHVRTALLICIIIGSIFSGQSKLQASHTWGFELTYECIGSCDVRVYLKGIRDCLGSSAAISYANVSATPLSSCPALPPLGPISSLTTWDVTPVCPSYQSQCQSSLGQFGIEYHQYYRDYSYCNLPPQCDYLFSFQSCCRTYASNVLENNSLGWAQNLTLKAGQASCNNSPVFNSPWRVFVPQDRPSVFDLGGIDPDGDSLFYILAPCLKSTHQAVDYKPGFSYLQPLGGSMDFQLDERTGNLYCTPQTQTSFATFICVWIIEIRNGVQVGQSMRDLLLIPISNGANNGTPQFEPYTNITGGSQDGRDAFTLCFGSTLQFDLPSNDPDPDTVSMSWNGGIPGASFVDANNGSVTDSISGLAPVGRFQFTPSSPGTYFFQTRIEDRACPIIGFAEKSIRIEVIDDAFISQGQLGCNEVNLTAHLCGSGPFTYQWSGANGVNGTNQTLNHTYSQPGTYAYQCIVTDVNQNQTLILDSVTVNAPTTQPVIDGLDSIQVCSALPQQLEALPGFTNHQWSTGSTAPNINISTGGWYYLDAEIPAGCLVRDSIYVEFLPDVYSNIIQSNIAPTLDPCIGNTSIQLSANGNYDTYSWSTGANSAQITALLPGTYHVTATYANGCSEFDSVEVDLVPADIYGEIRNFNNTLLVNQKVYLIKYNTNTQLLQRIDSTTTDQAGYYYFCNLNSSAAFYVQAAPDPAIYPFVVPTYGFGTMVWNETTPSYPTAFGPQQLDFVTLPRLNTGGPRSLGGQVLSSQTGNPVAGLRLFLILNNQAIVGHRDTDANGNFSFLALPDADYKIVPDRPYVDHISVPQLTLSPTNPNQDSLDFLLHPTFLELVIPTAAEIPGLDFSFSVSPNPLNERSNISLNLPETGSVHFEIFDAKGVSHGTIWEGELPQGLSAYQWEPQLAPGIYFLKVSSGQHQKVSKVVLL